MARSAGTQAPLRRNTRAPRWRWFFVALFVLLLAVGSAGVVVGQETEHCPGHQEAEEEGRKLGVGQSGSFDGVTVIVSGNTVTFENTTSSTKTIRWCAKGGENFSDGNQTSGVMTSTLAPGASKSFSFDQDISYLVVFQVTTEKVGGAPGEAPGPGEQAPPPAAPPAEAVVGQPVFTG